MARQRPRPAAPRAPAAEGRTKPPAHAATAQPEGRRPGAARIAGPRHTAATATPAAPATRPRATQTPNTATLKRGEATVVVVPTKDNACLLHALIHAPNATTASDTQIQELRATVAAAAVARRQLLPMQRISFDPESAQK